MADTTAPFVSRAQDINHSIYEAIQGMARLAMDETVGLSIRAQMYKELAQYVAPKRKAVEMSGGMGVSFIDAIRASYKHEHEIEQAQARPIK